MTTGRKHETEMNEAEKAALTARIREIAETVISTHAADRMTQKGVTAKEIEICLRYGNGIEIHNEQGELRAVVRHAYGRPKVAICVVIGLETGLIVTTWKNAGSDNHKTLNTYAYGWKENVVSLLAKRSA
jgi:hypothetical protein